MGFKPNMKLERAVLILSLDISRERKLTKRETEKCIDFLLGVLAEYKIPATWAVTGDFLLNSSYEPRNLQHESRFKDLHSVDICTDSCSDTSFFWEDILKKIFSSKVSHEMGYHSFSHPVFPQIRKEIADSEMKAGINMAEHFGFVLKSFVFPQDKIGHIDVLKKYGLLIYRGETLMHSSLRSRSLDKVNGLINEIIASPVMPEWKNGIWEIPSSMYFTDPKYHFSLLPRAKLGLWRAIRSKRVFHIWMHPWNLLEYTSLGRDFRLFMGYVSEKRNEGKIEVRTMGDFADYLNRLCNLEKARSSHGHTIARAFTQRKCSIDLQRNHMKGMSAPMTGIALTDNRRLAFPKVFPRQDKNAIANRLHRVRLKRILHMIAPNASPEKHYTLDIGCGNGSLSYVLSQNSKTVGVDVQRYFIKPSRKGRERIDFVVADINALPFKDHSFDMIICASVLEHLLDLELAIRKLKKLLKIPGILLAGYPVETSLFRVIWRIVSPEEFKFIDQTQIYFVDPQTHKMECYWNHPGTHKQTYRKIREVLRKHFRLVEQVKLPSKFLPDSMTYYECLKLLND